jgi:hypothetical protein
MSNYLPSEYRILRAMLCARRDKVWSIEEIADVLYAAKLCPASWRNSTVARMRTLSLKTQSDPTIRVLNINAKKGRGSVAAYQLKKLPEGEKKGFSSDEESASLLLS